MSINGVRHCRAAMSFPVFVMLNRARQRHDWNYCLHVCAASGFCEGATTASWATNQIGKGHDMSDMSLGTWHLLGLVQTIFLLNCILCQTFELQRFGGQYSSSTTNGKKWRHGIWYPNDNSKRNIYTCICKYIANLFCLAFSVDPLYPSPRKCWGEWLCSMQVMNFILVHGYQIFKRLDSLHGISALTSCGLVL